MKRVKVTYEEIEKVRSAIPGWSVEVSLRRHVGGKEAGVLWIGRKRCEGGGELVAYADLGWRLVEKVRACEEEMRYGEAKTV